MHIPRPLAALGAAVLLSLTTLTLASPAHADETYTGRVTATSPPFTGLLPDEATERCGTSGTPFTYPAGKVSFVSQSNGPRRFAVRAVGPTRAIYPLFVYRNGVCVGADLTPDPGPDLDESDEMATLTTDVEDIPLRVGDRVVVWIVPPVGASPPPPWRLDVTQPGTANAVAAGKGASYVKLPYQVACASRKAVVQVGGKAKARKVKSITFTAGGRTVGAVKGVRARQDVRLKGVPATATSIKAVVKLKGGGKAKVVRAYSRCG